MPKQVPFIFNRATETLDIFDFSWKDLIGVECSESGSTGVFYCQADNNRSFVIKGSSDIVPEYFVHLLFQRIGINIPKMRIIQFS